MGGDDISVYVHEIVYELETASAATAMAAPMFVKIAAHCKCDQATYSICHDGIQLKFFAESADGNVEKR